MNKGLGPILLLLAAVAGDSVRAAVPATPAAVPGLPAPARENRVGLDALFERLVSYDGAFGERLYRRLRPLLLAEMKRLSALDERAETSPELLVLLRRRAGNIFGVHSDGGWERVTYALRAFAANDLGSFEDYLAFRKIVSSFAWAEAFGRVKLPSHYPRDDTPLYDMFHLLFVASFAGSSYDLTVPGTLVSLTMQFRSADPVRARRFFNDPAAFNPIGTELKATGVLDYRPEAWHSLGRGEDLRLILELLAEPERLTREALEAVLYLSVMKKQSLRPEEARALSREIPYWNDVVFGALRHLPPEEALLPFYGHATTGFRDANALMRDPDYLPKLIAFLATPFGAQLLGAYARNAEQAPPRYYYDAPWRPHWSIASVIRLAREQAKALECERLLTARPEAGAAGT